MMAKKKSSLDELEKSELEVTDAAPVEKKKRRTKKVDPELANAETERNARSVEAEKPQAQTEAPKPTPTPTPKPTPTEAPVR
jgi:hypothetical protein